MLRNESYILRTIEDRYFLLPIGQQINWGRKSFEINTVGKIIWNKLKTDCSMDELADAVYKEFSDTDESNQGKSDFLNIAETDDLYKQIYKDVKSFVDILATKGAINYTTPITVDCKLYKIAGIGLRVFDQAHALESCLDEFEMSEPWVEEDPICVYIHKDYHPIEYGNGNVIIDSSDVKILEKEHLYELMFKTLEEINIALVYKENRNIYIDVKNPKGEDVLFALRLGYALYALQEGKMMLHSASFLYKDKIWLLSAPSGTGKSTHAALWEKYEGVKLVNGDSNLLNVDAGIVQGIPWCGTSKIYENSDYKLGGIFILERGERPCVEAYSFVDKVLNVTRRSLSPTWNGKMMSEVIDMSEEICKRVPVAKLVCNTEKESYEVLKRYIDGLE